jgi:deoxyribodipyrimidine photo-lyase
MDASAHPVRPDPYPPTPVEALARLDRVASQAGSRTRNHHDNAAARLAPYLTHGMLGVPDVIARLGERGRLRASEKLVFELGWREYFSHLWSRMGDDVFESRTAPPSPIVYDRQIPQDVLTASTGVPAIDMAVRALYECGYLHNHARMWLASYLVHLRKIDWQTGAAWMYGHLIDGDLGANHLSWQWVAGTLTGQPYLFNSGNVTRYAPLWASPGTVLDRGYLELRAIACGPDSAPAEPVRPEAIAPVPLSSAPQIVSSIDPALVEDRHVHLVHPWCLGDVPSGAVGIAAIHVPFHDRYPWADRRWEFVLRRMLAACAGLYVGDLREIGPSLARAAKVTTVATLNPGYREAIASVLPDAPLPPRFFDNPPTPARSFSDFWSSVKPKLGADAHGYTGTPAPQRAAS